MELQAHFVTLLGGLLVGIVAGAALLPNGRVAGLGGTVSGPARPRSWDAAWRALFLAGLVAGGTLLTWLDPAALPISQTAPLQLAVGAGLLVGFGARLGAGCTTR